MMARCSVCMYVCPGAAPRLRAAWSMRVLGHTNAHVLYVGANAVAGNRHRW